MSPQYSPSAPLTTGYVLFSRNGSFSNTELFLPIGGVVAPVIHTDVGYSATRLGPSETLVAVATGIPAGVQLIVEVQVALFTVVGLGARHYA